jgi:thiamine biosynthesis protein ThiS
MEKIKVTLNGKTETINIGFTVADIVNIANPRSSMFVVEHNFKILDKNDFGTILNDGDKIEIFSLFGGG